MLKSPLLIGGGFFIVWIHTTKETLDGIDSCFVGVFPSSFP